MMQYLLMVTVLHFSDSSQGKPMNVETLKFNTTNCELAEKSIREYYKNERSSRIVNLKCMIGVE